jgi:hypothetical protein
MNKMLLKTMLKPVIPKLGSWLSGHTLKEGETSVDIVLKVSGSDLSILICAFGPNEDETRPEIKRVIDRMAGEDLV